MTRTTRFRCLRTIALSTFVISLASIGFGQAKGGQAPPPQSSPGQQGGGRQPNNQPTFGDRTTQPGGFPNQTQQQIYLSGSVRLADGTVPPASVVIERVCGTVIRPEAYTDSKGNFSFVVGGQNPPVFEDASIQGPARMPNQQNGVDPRTLTGCQLRANLAGFISDSINIGFRQPLDDPEVGVIHIRRLDNVEGYTFSITTALAPKDAQRAYGKGLEDIKKTKWSDAEKDFSKAVELYPKYAVAWYDLGRVYQQEQKSDDAIRAFLEATKIDPKYINPYANLAVMAFAQQRWKDADQYTSQMLKLNPYVSPDFYFYSAVANYNLHKIDVAEQRAREAAKLDTQHKIPKINHLLGLVLAQKGDYKPAAENLRLYLQYSPNATDADDVKEKLTEIDQAIAEGH
jgi:tetratricopeptide (TPR) repeat protein